jgi:hypothetical protein
VRLVFLYGPVASGKLTVARALAEQTGLPLFHNHLVVDAVAALFPFGSPQFVALREEFWMRGFEEAARAGRSLIFTFAPESTVAADFPQRAREMVERHGGDVSFVALTLDPQVQRRRLTDESRAEFGKLRDLALFETLEADFARAMAEMPVPALSIDTGITSPDYAARQIASVLQGP